MTKPAQRDVAGLYFNDGCVVARDKIYVAGRLRGFDPDKYSFSRLCVYNARSRLAGGGPRWGYSDHPGRDVVSVCVFLPTGSLDPATGARRVAMASEGQIQLQGYEDPDPQEQLPDLVGSVSQIRHIGTALYACGLQGQVFRRDKGGWAHIDQGIRDPKISATALHLNGIDGTSDQNIYVCGFGGRILQFDGARWHEYSGPTNLHLERVLCVGPKEVYFCGKKGTFFRLINGGFRDFSMRTEEDFWGMAEFEGKIYLASLNGVYEFDGTRVRRVLTGLKPEIDGHRLDARDGQLWSFGVNDLASFDGKTWTRLKHPDNA